MGAKTLDRAVRDRELCERHLSPGVVLGGRCERAGCTRRPRYAIRVPVASGADRVLRLCERDAARRLRRLAMLPSPSRRMRLACRLARLSTRQFLELSGQATGYWFRLADAELAGGAL